MRLIDADALREKFQNLAYDDWNQGTGTTWANAFSEAENIVEDAPTIDAVPVIRCKYCKWCDENCDTQGYWPHWFCKNWYGGTDADGYCHEAERKEE